MDTAYNTRHRRPSSPGAAATETAGSTFALALWAVRSGIRTFPVDPRTYRSLLPHGAYKRRATTDESTLLAWWNAWPDAGVGLLLDDLAPTTVVQGDGGFAFPSGAPSYSIRVCADAEVLLAPIGGWYEFTWSDSPARLEWRKSYAVLCHGDTHIHKRHRPKPQNAASAYPLRKSR
jgi:Bifunctional DNA primase/polymerase, N-terminal